MSFGMESCWNFEFFGIFKKRGFQWIWNNLKTRNTSSDIERYFFHHVLQKPSNPPHKIAYFCKTRQSYLTRFNSHPRFDSTELSLSFQISRNGDVVETKTKKTRWKTGEDPWEISGIVGGKLDAWIASGILRKFGGKVPENWDLKSPCFFFHMKLIWRFSGGFPAVFHSNPLVIEALNLPPRSHGKIHNQNRGKPKKTCKFENHSKFLRLCFLILELPKIPWNFLVKKPLDLVRLPRTQ